MALITVTHLAAKCLGSAASTLRQSSRAPASSPLAALASASANISSTMDLLRVGAATPPQPIAPEDTLSFAPGRQLRQRAHPLALAARLLTMAARMQQIEPKAEVSP